MNILMRSKEEIIEKLDELKKEGGFNIQKHSDIDLLIDSVTDLRQDGVLKKQDLTEINTYFGVDFLQNTLQGRALLKRYGYAGDFSMIDDIYLNRCSEDSFYGSWDAYFLSQAAPKAVRNRKEIFKAMVLQKLNQNNSLNILNIASGPARDILEIYQSIDDNKRLNVTCVEADQFAIQYAKEITSGYEEYIEFINKNIFKYNTEEKFDLIWSAGAFDYFNDKYFTHLLTKLKRWTTRSGEIVIGNFNSEHNPTRNYMELFGEWYLHHRSESDLIKIGELAGFKRGQMHVTTEPENVNLFLHVQF